MNWQWFLFSFKGRLNRKPFWIFTLVTSLLGLVLILFSGSDLWHFNKDPKRIVYGIVILWPALSVHAKRWHDLNKSAWHMLVNLIPIIGPFWALIQTGFMPGTPGLNRYGNDPLSKVEDKSRKVFVSGASTPYFMEIMLFIVLPIGVLWILVGSLMRGNWPTLIMIIPLFLILGFIFRFLRKKMVYKIITDDTGISVYGLLKQIYLPWPKVVSIRANKESFQDMIEVITKDGNFAFSVLMKNEAEEYPKIKIGITGTKWAYSDGTSDEVSVENNPLYLEINRQLK